jgi:membrane-associated phospholipid phosphatase
LGYAGLRPKTHLVFWMWTFATYISAMTTKQHHFLDILVGVTVMVINAELTRALFEKKVKIWSSLKKSQVDTI